MICQEKVDFHEEAFEVMKKRLFKPPVMHLLDDRRRFQLFSDTSKAAKGSALYQIQDGTPKLLGCTGKRLPPAAVNYSIRELELIGLCVNINQFKHLLAKVDFDCTVDHLALTYIISLKIESARVGIKRLLEVLSVYSFNLYYMKGQDMTLINSLSRKKVTKLNPLYIISFSFDLKQVPQKNIFRLGLEHKR